MEAPKAGTLWRSHKGHNFVVVGTARHTETRGVLVLYRSDATYDSSNLARPLEMWYELVEGEPRFKEIGNEG